MCALGARCSQIGWVGAGWGVVGVDDVNIPNVPLNLQRMCVTTCVGWGATTLEHFIANSPSLRSLPHAEHSFWSFSKCLRVPSECPSTEEL